MPLPPLTPQNLTILMTDRGGRHYLLYDFGAPPLNAPPPPDATILNYLTDREGEGGEALPFVKFWRPPIPPPTPQYLTILMTERGWDAIIFCRILAPPPPPPPPFPRRHNT